MRTPPTGRAPDVELSAKRQSHVIRAELIDSRMVGQIGLRGVVQAVSGICSHIAIICRCTVPGVPTGIRTSDPDPDFRMVVIVDVVVTDGEIRAGRSIPTLTTSEFRLANDATLHVEIEVPIWP